MKTKKTIAVVEASTTGFSVYAESEELPLHGYGKTIDEAKKDMADALEEMLDYFSKKKLPVPPQYNSGNLEFEYRYDLASIFRHFGMLDATNFAKRIGMNPSLLRQYKSGSAAAGKKAKEKIEKGLHQLGRELLEVKL